MCCHSAQRCYRGPSAIGTARRQLERRADAGGLRGPTLLARVRLRRLQPQIASYFPAQNSVFVREPELRGNWAAARQTKPAGRTTGGVSWLEMRREVGTGRDLGATCGWTARDRC